MSRVAAKLWQTAQKMPVLPVSVLRYWASTVANATPVPLSDVGLNFGSTMAVSMPVIASRFTFASGTLST